MEHVIKMNKSKQILGIIVSLVFIGLGSAIIADPHVFGNPPFSKASWFAISITLVLIFATVLIFLAYKMATKQPGLIINAEGIQNNTSALKLGLVTWEEITGFGIKKQIGIPFIVVYLNDPDAFMQRYSGLGKKLIKKNTEEFNTPFAIGTTMLDIKLDELKRIIEAEGARRGLKFDD